MRKLKPQLERIDIDELFNNSSNRGMLSFLERPPEEAQLRLRERRRVDQIDSQRLILESEPPGVAERAMLRDSLPEGSSHPESTLYPLGNSPSGRDSPPKDGSQDQLQGLDLVETNSVGCLYPEGELPPVCGSRLAVSLPSQDSIRDLSLESVNEPIEVARHSPPPEVPHPEGNSTGVLIYPVRKSPPGVMHPDGTLPAGRNLRSKGRGLPHSTTNLESNSPTAPTADGRSTTLTGPEGNLRTGDLPTASLIESNSPQLGHPEGHLPPASTTLLMDGAVIGRRQKVRRAMVAQDGHSSGEQLLYQSLWNAANVETPETRLISIGYNGMSALCKLDKSNCKKNIQNLVEKLSVQITATFQSASSTGTTYRIFSYREILRRREAAGLVWVIRTSGVRFVSPVGKSPIPPRGTLPMAPMGDLHPLPRGEAPSGPRGETRPPPVCETPTPLGIHRKLEETSSGIVRDALSKYGPVDQDAVTRLVKKCREHTFNCSDEEISHFIHEKGLLIRGQGKRIQNPIGFLIDAVPKCFSGDAIRLYRESREQTWALEDVNQESIDREWGREHEADLLDPTVPEEVKQVIRRCLGLS